MYSVCLLIFSNYTVYRFNSHYSGQKAPSLKMQNFCVCVVHVELSGLHSTVLMLIGSRPHDTFFVVSHIRPATIHRCISTSRYFLPRYEYHILNKVSRY